MINRESKYFFNHSNFLTKTIGSRSILVDNSNFKMIAVNETGNLILELLNGKNSVDELVGKLCRYYDLPVDVIEEYICEYISKLYSDGLIYLNDRYKLESEYLSIKRLYVELTNNDDKTKLKYNEMPMNKIKEIFDYVDKNKSDEEIFVYLKGDPMMHSKFSEIIRFIGQKSYAKIWIFTDPDKINDETIKLLKENINVIVLKLYHIDETLNDNTMRDRHFQNFVNNAKCYVENKIPCYVMITPTVKNADIIHEIQRLSYDLGMNGMIIEEIDKENGQDIGDYEELIDRSIKKVKDNNVFLNSWKNNRIQSAPNLFNLIMERDLCFRNNYWMKKRKHCGIGIEEISVDNKGLIYPCHRLHYDKFSSKDIIEYNDKKRLYRGNVINSKCKECYYWIFCLGGCRAKDYNDEDLSKLRKDCEEIKGKLESYLFRV